MKQIGVIQETRGYRPSNHYGVSNLLMLKHMFPDIPVFELMNQKIRTCSSCGQVLVRDFDRTGEQRVKAVRPP